MVRTLYTNNLLPKQIACITFMAEEPYETTDLSNTYLCAKWHINKMLIV